MMIHIFFTLAGGGGGGSGSRKADRRLCASVFGGSSTRVAGGGEFEGEIDLASLLCRPAGAGGEGIDAVSSTVEVSPVPTSPSLSPLEQMISTLTQQIANRRKQLNIVRCMNERLQDVSNERVVDKIR
jgi:hypothetical protein